MNAATILIVEDEAIVAADLAGKLEHLGYAVVGVAGHAQEAVELASRLQPELVLMDILLEGSIDGIETAGVIKTKCDAPVIYLTAHSDRATLERAKVTGPFGFILKPFDTRDLATQIELALFQHQAERRLRESEERYRSVFNNTQAVMLLVDPRGGQILDANPAACQFYGYSKEHMIRLNIAEINRASAAQIGAMTPEKEALQHCHLHQQHRLSDGRLRDVEVFCGPVVIEGRELNFSIVHDITDRKRAEEAMRQSEERLKRAQEIAHLGSWELDRQRNELTWSDEVYRIFGLAPRQFAATYEAFLAAVHPEDHRRVDEAYAASLRQGQETYEVEHRVVRPDGEVRYVHQKCEHQRDSAGRVIRSVGMVHDITAGKRAAEALARSNRDLEHFAYAASHDLQEPLRSIVGFLQLLERDHSDQIDAQGRHYLERAIAAGQRMQSLIRDLLSLSRVTTRRGEYATTDLNRLVREVLGGIEATLQEKNTRVVCEDLPTLCVDASQIRRLFQNLVMNAVKYTQDSVPRVAIGCRRIETGYQFSVADNGIGIDSRFHERIFMVFQRLHTEKEYPGTGLGLALCKKIVERHGGKIWVESQPAQGATFYFTLPAAR